jgi:hypothetical protein
VSTLKVNAIEKYSGASGVTIKDSVSIAPDSGVKNLVVSGTITAETALVATGTTTCQGNATFNGNIAGDGNTDITGVDNITTSGNLNVGGSLTVNNVLQFNPFKCMGSLTHNSSADSITARAAEFNVSNATSYASGLNSMIKVEFATALSNTNYQVFFQSPLMQAFAQSTVWDHFVIVQEKNTDYFTLQVQRAGNNGVFGASRTHQLDFIVVSP